MGYSRRVALGNSSSAHTAVTTTQCRPGRALPDSKQSARLLALSSSRKTLDPAAPLAGLFPRKEQRTQHVPSCVV
eukprot:2904928-Amphidinium_carterae.1